MPDRRRPAGRRGQARSVMPWPSTTSTSRSQDGEFFSLLGPVRLRQDHHPADDRRLRAPTSGRIELQGQDVTWLPPYKRPVNTVFQSYALFPHMTIFENVAFGLRRKKVKDDEVKQRVTEMLELVELPRLRAPQANPDLGWAGAARGAGACADQPAAVPAPGRAAGRAGPQAAQADAGRAQAYPARGRDHLHLRDPRPGGSDDDVGPHRRDEQGRYEQLGDPESLYERPATRFVAGFLGVSNLLPGTVGRTDGDVRAVRLPRPARPCARRALRSTAAVR